jgi:uncharacterized MAPEG superfamily protein
MQAAQSNIHNILRTAASAAVPVATAGLVGMPLVTSSVPWICITVLFIIVLGTGIALIYSPVWEVRYFA